MAEQLVGSSIAAPGFKGINTQDSSVTLESGFATIANNCVIDKFGRIGARKGWLAKNTTSTDLGSNPIEAIGELIGNDGTSYIICAGNGKLFKLSGTTLVTLTYGGGGSAPTISANSRVPGKHCNFAFANISKPCSNIFFTSSTVFSFPAIAVNLPLWIKLWQ